MSDTTRLDLDATEARAIVARRLNVARVGKSQMVRAETAVILAREDVPALVARVRELEAEVERLRHEVETHRDAMPAFSALYADHRGILTDSARRRAHLALTYPRRELDGGPDTEEPDRG